MYHSADDTAALGICVSGPGDGASPPKRVDEARGGGPSASWGSETPIRDRTAQYDQVMWSLLYLVVRALVRLLVRSGRPDRDDGAKDLEILVLRHQLQARG